MDDLLDYINGLVGICLLPEPDDSTEDVSNESSEDEDSDKIIIVLCAIRTRSSSLVAFVRARSLPLLHHYDVMYFPILHLPRLSFSSHQKLVNTDFFSG